MTFNSRWDDEEGLPAPGHRLRVEDSAGSSVVFNWLPGDRSEIFARFTFDNRVGLGYYAFRLTQDGGKAFRITKFEPAAHDILVTKEISWPLPAGYNPATWANSPQAQGTSQPKGPPYKITDSDRRFLTPGDWYVRESLKGALKDIRNINKTGENK